MVTFEELKKTFADLEIVRGQRTSFKGFSSLKLAGCDEASFFVDERYRDELSASNAGVLIAHTKRFPFVFEAFKGTVWHSPDPLPVLAALGAHLEKVKFGDDEQWSEVGVHPTAVVEEGAEIHPEAFVGPYCVVRKGVVIEARVSLLAYVYVGCHVKIGARAVVGSHVSIMAYTQIGKESRIMAGTVLGSKGFGVLRDGSGKTAVLPQLGDLSVGEQAFIGSNVTIDRATYGTTRVGPRGCIDDLARVGHNAHIGSDLILCSLSAIGGSATIGDRVTVGGCSAIKDHTGLGNDSTLTGMSGIANHKFKPGSVLRGVPAQLYPDQLRFEGALRRVPKLIKRVKDLEKRLEQLENEEREL